MLPLKPETKIRREIARMTELYEGVDENKRAIIIPLIENAAFMKVTLDGLQRSINESGCSEEYKNGENQYGRKAAADFQAYNALIKNYNTVTDRLEKLLPAKSAASKLKGMMRDE